MLLVTGITGHTGRYFLQELVKNNYKDPIRCIVRKNSNVELLKRSGLNIEIVVGDLNDENFTNEIMKDIHTVMHIYNIHHSPSIIQAGIANKIKRAILVHTTGIYSKFKDASIEYIKVESEVLELAKQNRLNLTILRPTMIYGDMCDHNMSKFIKMINKMKIYPLIDSGKGLIQPVNARDLGQAYYNVLMNPELTSNKQYNLSGDKPISIKVALSMISNKLNKKTLFIPVSLKLSSYAASGIKILSLGKIDIVEKVLRMGENRAYNHELAKKDFNFTPMDFEKGIEIEINEFKSLENK
ncbi:NAD-dependent epimerase/dehydratase family protein [Peribacillus frigoritolerans]|uniref:SDR family oxidoreductase n=1 Tax=Peribacillus frigoritolerans TaxID=450367 RepID=UPI0020797AE2|nr:NAD(P)H-binding protein [Peribacillus frigoritolerans]USK78805.1 NAD-dependent epimerase/dehydratase family protein [Peribacillus frigoritolerans]